MANKTASWMNCEKMSTLVDTGTVDGSNTRTGYWWLLESDSRQGTLPPVLRTAQAHPTWMTWSNHTPRPVHSALLLPIGMRLQYCEGGPETAQQNLDCLLTWLHNGGMSYSSGQQKLLL